MQLRLSMVTGRFPRQDLRAVSTGSNAEPGPSSAPEGIDNDKPSLQSLGGWQLHQGDPDCSARRLSHLENGLSAKHWLQSCRKDPFAIDTMRRALREEGLPVSLVRLRDDDVIEHVANLVKRGVWHVCEPVEPVYKVIVAEQPSFIPVPRRGPASSQSAPASNAPEQPTLAGNADQAGIAAVLAQAAQDGTPFCEECAKAAVGRA